MKVFVDESGAEIVRALLEGDGCATSSIAYVECRSAFARRLRDGFLSRANHAQLASRLEARWEDLLVIDVDDALIREAGSLVDDGPLRAGDAIHLASARYVKRRTGSVAFACWDRRLWAAAAAEGFVMVPAEEPP